MIKVVVKQVYLLCYKVRDYQNDKEREYNKSFKSEYERKQFYSYLDVLPFANDFH